MKAGDSTAECTKACMEAAACKRRPSSKKDILKSTVLMPPPLQGELYFGELCDAMPNLTYLSLRSNLLNGSLRLNTCRNLTSMYLGYNR